jgi:DNA-binding IclR family transcriptional regulator
MVDSSQAKSTRSAARSERDSYLPVAADPAPPTAGLVKSANRVLRILEFFDEVQREARVAEIAERLSFPQSSTSVLLQSLTALGYLEHDRVSRTYLPSPRVTLLGMWLDKGPLRNGSLIRMMEELSQETGETIILAARNGIYSQYIHVIQARSEMRFHVPQGSRRLAVWSGTGFALLAGASDRDIRALVTRTNAEAPKERSVIDHRVVLRHVGEVREKGVFFSRGLVTPGAGSMAMPLPRGIETRDRPLALAVSGLLDRFIHREAELVALMRDVVERYLAPVEGVSTNQAGP